MDATSIVSSCSPCSCHLSRTVSRYRWQDRALCWCMFCLLLVFCFGIINSRPSIRLAVKYAQLIYIGRSFLSESGKGTMASEHAQKKAEEFFHHDKPEAETPPIDQEFGRKPAVSSSVMLYLPFVSFTLTRSAHHFVESQQYYGWPVYLRHSWTCFLIGDMVVKRRDTTW